MKKSLIISNALLAIPFLIIFRRGANVSLFMLPVWLIATIVNAVLSKNIKEFLIYNGTLTAFGIAGIFINSLLYFKYVYFDSEGELVVVAQIFIGLIYIAILTGIEYIFKKLIIKYKKK